MSSKLPWTHFYVDPKTNAITGFNVDTCETCGGLIQAANNINIREPRSRLLRLGLVESAILLPEGWHCDETGKEVCDVCG